MRPGTMEVRLSADIFPPVLVGRILNIIHTDIRIKSVRYCYDEVVLSVASVKAGSDREALKRFREILTDAALVYWADQPLEPRRRAASLEKPDRRMNVTVRLVEEHEEVRLVVTADRFLHPPAALLQSLAGLRGKVSIVLESTNPLDRVIISIRLPADSSKQTTILQLITDIIFPGLTVGKNVRS